jgi:hypothetical protein
MAPSGSTRSARALSVATDRERLKHVLVNYLGEPSDEVPYQNSETYLALEAAGILTSTDLFSTSERDIEQLVVPEIPASGSGTTAVAAVPAHTLALVKRRKLIIAIALYHYICYSAGKGNLDISTVDTASFDAFRTDEYDPTVPIVPWKKRLATTAPESEAAAWKKNVRPSTKDYKVFRDDAYWSTAKEHFESTIRSHGLDNFLEHSFQPVDKELDTAQGNWIFKVLQDTMLAPAAKAIVNKHKSDRDVRQTWKEICDKYESSMSSTLRASKLSAYISGTRLDQINWRGSQATFILHYQEQTRLYNEISEDPYSDRQLINFLQVCVSGVPNLSQVYTLHLQTIRSAGLSVSWSFAEYVEALLQQAAVFCL